MRTKGPVFSGVQAERLTGASDLHKIAPNFASDEEMCGGSITSKARYSRLADDTDIVSTEYGDSLQ